MPPKRRTSTPSTRTQQQRAQSTLSFGKGAPNRVTKPTAAQQGKRSKKDPALLDITPAEAEPDLDEPTTADAAIQEQATAAVQLEETAVADPLAHDENVKAEEVLGGRAPESQAGAVGGRGGSGWIGSEEAEARKITETQVKAYWRAKERERKAPRVHQEGLTVGEKILREWDMSGQYGVSRHFLISTRLSSPHSTTLLTSNTSHASVSPDLSDGREPTLLACIHPSRYWLSCLKAWSRATPRCSERMLTNY